jgi:hypothetical protein
LSLLIIISYLVSVLFRPRRGPNTIAGGETTGKQNAAAFKPQRGETATSPQQGFLMQTKYQKTRRVGRAHTEKSTNIYETKRYDIKARLPESPKKLKKSPSLPIKTPQTE